MWRERVSQLRTLHYRNSWPHAQPGPTVETNPSGTFVAAPGQEEWKGPWENRLPASIILSNDDICTVKVSTKINEF